MPPARSARHDAVFPDELPRRAISMCTLAGDVVLDPFAGTGTTGRVAIELGSLCILVELHPSLLYPPFLAHAYVHNGRSEHHTTLAERQHDFSGEFVLVSKRFFHPLTSTCVPELNVLYCNKEGERTLIRYYHRVKVTRRMITALRVTCGLASVPNGAFIFGYVLTHDTNLAPCVHEGVLTLGVCMPGIRRMANVGDVVVAFGSAPRGCTQPRVVYTFVVDKKVPFVDYFSVGSVFKGRPDDLYDPLS